MTSDTHTVPVAESVESVSCRVGRAWLDSYGLDAERYTMRAQLYLMARFPTAPGGVAVNIVPGNGRPTVTLVQTALYREIEQTLANL